MDFNEINNIAVIGLGYVGLPLAIEFSKHYRTIGFDIDKNKVDQINQNLDSMDEYINTSMLANHTAHFTNDREMLYEADVFVVTVPTPINEANEPDLSPLVSATELVAEIMKPGCLVIYESTVYPGLTEEVCVPILEKSTKGKLNQDFYVGYSPERINPGGQGPSLTEIVKLTSGSDPATANTVDLLYKKIIKAGTYLAPSIKVAEAAKIVENVQRDINISLMNELSIVFSHLDINISDVINAAKTKWNFLPFTPGLVGGHCIGVDPYYLIHKSKMENYHPPLISTSRDVNESYSSHIVKSLIKSMARNNIDVTNAKVLILGFSFKENCADIRNTKVIDLVNKMKELNIEVDVVDPIVNREEVMSLYNVHIEDKIIPNMEYDAVILAVPHRKIIDLGEGILREYLKSSSGIFYDIKGFSSLSIRI
ncbi:nucleotide sugar dehydrogenase [Vibrio cholerae]|nr:nucleotide sugar dehydrogenase [Vibrio cholerae]ELY5193030.1 nucleotide sugar dehydrogenase [Vibrio cholerae]